MCVVLLCQEREEVLFSASQTDPHRTYIGRKLHSKRFAVNRVRSARLARHANQSDVTTAPTVPAAVIAAMVCSRALKNSSIIRSTYHQHQRRVLDFA